MIFFMMYTTMTLLMMVALATYEALCGSLRMTESLRRECDCEKVIKCENK